MGHISYCLQQELWVKQHTAKAADMERAKEEKKMMSSRAYHQWLLNKQVEEHKRKKDQRIEQEFKVLCEEQQKADRERAEATFVSWKKRKDLERALSETSKQQTWNEVESMGSIKPTPPLPGYCSVWSCDEELAEHMITKVQRPS